MKTHDPVKIQFLIHAERVIQFVFIVALLTLMLWLGPLWQIYQLQSIESLWQATLSGWQGDNPTGWLLMRFAFALALATVTCFYLVLALCWKRSSERHHRGAQLVDGR